MPVRKLLYRTATWVRSLGHLGRLGKIAATRSFLLRERKKLLLKLGEKSLLVVRERSLPLPELSRLVQQIEKIDQLLAKQDYGGEEGVDFLHLPRKPKKKR